MFRVRNGLRLEVDVYEARGPAFDSGQRRADHLNPVHPTGM